MELLCRIGRLEYNDVKIMYNTITKISKNESEIISDNTSNGCAILICNILLKNFIFISIFESNN